MTWQNGRELATYSDGTKDVVFKYDPNGLRTMKTVVGAGGNVKYVKYVYGGGLLQQMDYDGYIFNFSYDANGSPVGFHVKEDGYIDAYYYYGLNSRGDVEALYNANGTIYAKYEYDAYGKLLGITDVDGYTISSAYDIAVLNPLRYRSYVYDTETGFYYLQSRYYDPVTCRFINGDSQLNIATINGFNQFAYCDNNPINKIDPTGHFWEEILNFAQTAITEIGKAIGVVSPTYAFCGGAVLVDGPIPIGDIIGAGVAILVTAGAAIYGINNAVQIIQEAPITIPKAEEKDGTINKEPNSPVVFPVNPNEFNPVGLKKVPREGTKNGALISWMDPVTNTEVFRWDENPNHSNGPHYHIYGTGHYEPNTEVPEPYVSLYFPHK